MAFLLLGGFIAATISGAAGFGGALLLLPIASMVVGPREAVPLLTLAQLVGNLSRAGLGWREISWQPVFLFSLGAVPASALGAILFISLPSAAILRFVGVFMVLMVLLRRTKLKDIRVPEGVLFLGGASVGFLSAVVGSAGTLGALIFLGLDLPATAYVASEAVAALAVHITKSGVYTGYSLISGRILWITALLSVTMIAGSWTGKQVIERLPKEKFLIWVEALMLVAAVSLIVLGSLIQPLRPATDAAAWCPLIPRLL